MNAGSEDLCASPDGASQDPCPPGCPKCADEYLAAKEAEEQGLPCAECGQIAYPENYECACSR